MAVLRKLNTEINLSGDGDKELRAWIKDLVDARKEGVSMSGGINEMEKEMIDAARQIGLTRDQLKDMAEATKKNKDIQAFSNKYGFAMSEIQTKTRDARGAVDGLSSAMTALAAAGIGSKLLGSAGEMSKLAMKTEDLSISLEVMLKDAKLAKKTLMEFKEFSDVSPFEPGPVNEAGKAMLQFGIKAKDVRKNMQLVGDVAAGTDQDFTNMARLYGKAYALKKVDNEMLQQVPVLYAAIGKAIGKNETQVFDLASKGQISFDMLQKGFEGLTSKGGDFFQSMEKRSKSTSGVLSTFSGNVDTVKISVGSMINEGLRPLADVGNTVLGWLIKTPWAMGVLKGAILALTPVAALFFGSVLFKAIQTMGLLKIETLKFAASMVVAFLPVYLIIAAVMALILVFEDLWVWMNGGESLLGGWINKGGVLGTVIKVLTAPMRVLVWIVKDLWNAFSGGPSVIAGVFGKVKGFFSSLLDFFKKYGKYFIMAIFPVSAIYFYWDQIMAFFTAMPGRIVAFFTSLPGKIMAALSGLKSQLKDYFMGLAPGWVVKLFGEKSEEKQEVEARAGGGPVSGGKPYLVGEEGPELFVPSGNGSIVPGGGSGGGKAGGGGITISPVLNFYGPASREDASAIADKVQRAIKDCIPAVRGMLGLEAV